MLLPAILLTSVLISTSRFPFAAHAKLSADCTFQQIKSWKIDQNTLAPPLGFRGQLPFSKNRKSHTCLLKTNDSNRMIYLGAKRNKWSKEGSLHLSVYEEVEGSLSTSHLGISTSQAGWKTCPFCPTMREVSEKHLLFSGTAGVSFMVEMQQEGSIQLDEPVEVKLSAKDSYPAVYQFIPAEDISSAQLDVTVTSESKNVPAYLKVSRDCKDVRDNIDVVDYKGESIRLSFTKKGRITLSKFSIPPLTASNSSWFIGIAIKNASGYALAWALCFEGMFSALYHLCPSRFTFQFDTAFMFVIAALSVVLLYNGIGMQSCTREVEAKRRVGAANLFLFFLVPLLIFNYFGTMYHSEAGLDVKLQIPFFLFLILWFLIIALWAGSKLLPKLCCKCHCKCCECCCSCCTIIFVFCAFGFVLIPVLLIVLWSTKVIEFSDAILWFCVAESCIASVGSFCVGLKCESSCFSNSKDRFKKLWDRICDQNCCSKEECCSFFKVTCKLLYTCSILALNCFALWIFFDRETTDKSKSPEKSRDLNQECIFLAFFDWHDVWHISSSFGLLMGALMVIHVSYKSPRLVRRQSQTGAASGASDELRPDSIIMDAPDKQDLKENAQNTPSNYENVPLSFENPCTVSNRDDVRTPARGLQNMTQSFEERNNQCISEMRSSKRFAKRH
ncbi:uncharacterized protein LOC111331881 isoform X3 [Stylophora pistillata]|uniref:uncharacterized protein LOC111331881 isoform X3 n=1 Tax=Stylophora pistillata TaxID=50429 RepID=UPI000C049434|nr:uncharacterized protein LOC111331881 isoform X3 [Stylophora pistillata]